MKENMEAIVAEIEKNEEEIKNNYEKIEENPEIEKLKEYQKEVKKIKKNYNMLFLIEPSEKGEKSYKQEYAEFYRKIEDDLDEDEFLSDEEYSEMSPVFKYDRMNDIDIDDLNRVILEIQEIRERAKEEFEDENIAQMVFEIIDIAEAEMGVIKNSYNKNYKEAFECSEIVYGEIDEELFEICNEMYENSINGHKNPKEVGKTKKDLLNLEFDAEQIKAFFNMAIIKAGLRDSGFEAVVTDAVNNMRVSMNYPGFDHPVIMIPKDRKIDGLKLLKLIAHEVCRHVATNVYNEKNGFSSDIGRDWNLFSEGIALTSEDELEKQILGDDYQEDYNSSDRIYYILAMEKIRGEKNDRGDYENGWNYGKVYKYIYRKKYKEELYRQKYYDIEKELESSVDQKMVEKKIESIENESKKNAADLAEKICLRVFKGFDPKEGGYFLLKDKIYIEGKIKSEELKKIDSKRKAEKYLRLSKIDLRFIPHLIKSGAYSYEKGIEASIKVAEKMWKEQGWSRDLLKGDKKSELFIPYMNQFMDDYYKDEWKNFYEDEQA